MLHELRIENLLLIERAELRFGPGLNAITGETGAGKTMLAHALDLLMGGKPRGGVVRPGAEEAYVEGVFELPPGLLADPGPELEQLAERMPEGETELVIARRVSASGRTSAFVQGRSANLAELRALGPLLLAFYGQHEHRRLTVASAQRRILDGFAGAEHLAAVESCRRADERVRAIERELTELDAREGGRERDLDLMRFELAEIETVSPDPAEQDELVAERDRLRHLGSLQAAAGTAHAVLAGDDGGEGGAASALAAGSISLGNVGGVDPSLDALAQRVEGALVEIEDLASELRSYLDSAEAEPGRLEAVEERLAEVDRLTRKHGGSVDAVLAHADRCRGEIERLEGASERRDELAAQLAEARAERLDAAAIVSAGRRRAVAELEPAVAAELSALAMDGARLEAALIDLDDGPGATGSERVELRVATNPGMPVSPLRDAASGGEVSRIMLALSVLSGGGGEGPDGPAMVFDEIDAGIGGTTGRAVGERLRALGEATQVICITHLAQVASLASAHFTIAKSGTADLAGEPALATVERVEGDALVVEIARMLGSEGDDEVASRHARQLLAA